MAKLGAPFHNRFGLRPAAADLGEPARFHVATEDWQHVLSGVPHLNLHPHLPHFEIVDAAGSPLEVLARQVVSIEAPAHPVMPPGSLFDSVLQARPESELGRLTICEATLWTSNNGGAGEAVRRQHRPLSN
jgi:hypothetical protein